MPNFEEIDRSRKLLTIGDQVTLKQINQKPVKRKFFNTIPTLLMGFQMR